MFGGLVKESDIGRFKFHENPTRTVVYGCLLRHGNHFLSGLWNRARNTRSNERRMAL